MFIQCPQCSTGYNIPEANIVDKPRKMRCARCKNLFTVARKSESTPPGYEEFTGKSNLPSEFAFLRQAPEKPEVKKAGDQTDTQSEMDLAPSKDTAGLYRSIVEGPEDQIETIPLEPKPISGPSADSKKKPQSVENESSSSTSLEQPDQVTSPGLVGENAVAAESVHVESVHVKSSQPVTTDRTPSVPDIYTSVSTWETEAPLELEGFAIPEETSKAQFYGKLATAITSVVVIFFIFVAYQNQWSLSFSDLPKQIGIAFSGGSADVLPDEVKDLETTKEQTELVMRGKKNPFLVVKGTVFNNGSIGRSNVMLRARILDSSGHTMEETRFPCAKIMDKENLQGLSKDKIDLHYRTKGKIHNCRLGPNATAFYQLIIDAPSGYDASCKVDIMAVAARYSK